LKSHGKGYQTFMNALLGREMLEEQEKIEETGEEGALFALL
jgi:hypothetical protein